MPPRIHQLARILPILLLLLLAPSGPALAADNVGPVGPIVLVAQNTTSGDTYLQYHGRMVVGDSVGGYLEYRWGGTACGSRVLSEGQVSQLLAAMNNPRILVRPLWQDGQGSSSCLVGYSFVLRSETGAL